MPSNPHLNKLVDVVALSQKLCPAPIKATLAYAGTENFIGRKINGYSTDANNFALLTQDTATALCAVQNDLIANHNMRLLIYDTYRPRRAVMDFVEWSKQPVDEKNNESARKAIHYPRIEKKQMFELGYVSANSNHCLGHTVDLVLTDAAGNELEHGVCYDFMDELSHQGVTAEQIGETAVKNREILRIAMEKADFESHAKEYWHFHYKNRLVDEPMDFEITAELRGLNVEA
jgi:D-alanyl-D-alanine dipeptidase